MPKIQDQALIRALHDIYEFLSEGITWHEMAAASCYHMPARGWSDWHREEAENDKRVLSELSEALKPSLEEMPTERRDRPKRIKLNSPEDFKQHHIEWLDREESLYDSLRFAMGKTEYDPRLNKVLSTIAKEVHDEIKLVEYAYDSLDFTSWMPHDISVKSYFMRHYFKTEHKKDGPIRFDLG